MATGQFAVGDGFHPTPHLLHAVLTKFAVTLVLLLFLPYLKYHFHVFLYPLCLLLLSSDHFFLAQQVLQIFSDSCFVVGENNTVLTKAPRCHCMTHISSHISKPPLLPFGPGGKRHLLNGQFALGKKCFTQKS